MLNFCGKLNFSLNIIAFLAFMDVKLKVKKKVDPFSKIYITNKKKYKTLS